MRNIYERTTKRPGQAGASWELDLASRCEAPRYIMMRGDPDPLAASQNRERATPLYCGAWVRCRSCAWCLTQRRALWAGRAASELLRAPRTWFVTLTLSPENHAKMLATAIVAGRTADTEDATFRARHWAISREITRYFKRLRKAGHVFRYALVCERHDGKGPSRPGAQTVRGMPHYHLLVHEVVGARGMDCVPVLRDDGSILHDKSGRLYYEGSLSKHWRHGHVVIKEVDQTSVGAAAHYLAKYLAKDARARVRASRGYGADFCVNQLNSRPQDIASQFDEGEHPVSVRSWRAWRSRPTPRPPRAREAPRPDRWSRPTPRQRDERRRSWWCARVSGLER